MTTAPLAPLTSLTPFAEVVNLDASFEPMKTAAPSSTFGQWFSKELTVVNDRLLGADRDIQKLAVGEDKNLHEIMIHLEEARLSFQLLAQVRNRVLEAYQEVMRMPI